MLLENERIRWIRDGRYRLRLIPAAILGSSLLSSTILCLYFRDAQVYRPAILVSTATAVFAVLMAVVGQRYSLSNRFLGRQEPSLYHAAMQNVIYPAVLGNVLYTTLIVVSADFPRTLFTPEVAASFLLFGFFGLSWLTAHTAMDPIFYGPEAFWIDVAEVVAAYLMFFYLGTGLSPKPVFVAWAGVYAVFLPVPWLELWWDRATDPRTRLRVVTPATFSIVLFSGLGLELFPGLVADRTAWTALFAASIVVFVWSWYGPTPIHKAGPPEAAGWLGLRKPGLQWKGMPASTVAILGACATFPVVVSLSWIFDLVGAARMIRASLLGGTLVVLIWWWRWIHQTAQLRAGVDAIVRCASCGEINIVSTLDEGSWTCWSCDQPGDGLARGRRPMATVAAEHRARTFGGAGVVEVPSP